MTQNLHHIVIVGGGAGGLELATQLGETFGKNGKAKITLVDQNLTHIWKPLLHEIAAGSLNPHEEQTNYFAHAEKHHYEFVLGTLTAVNKDKKIIDLIPPQVSKEQNIHIQQLSYDTLVLALGSVSNDFNTPVFVKTAISSIAVNRRIFSSKIFYTYISKRKINPINVH